MNDDNKVYHIFWFLPELLQYADNIGYTYYHQ